MAQEPRRGGVLTMVLAADPPGLDPVQLQGVQNWAEAVAVSCIYDQLFYPDPHGRPQPKIGVSLISADQGLTWTLTLREGVRFSDGAPLDAEAVRFNWARLADPANRAPSIAAAGLIAEMRAEGPLTLRITLRAPDPRFDRRVMRSLSAIASPAASDPVGAGPFRLAEWTRGERMRFVRNPDYWQSGKPYLDEVVVLTGIPDAAAKFEAVASGRAQVSLEPAGAHLARYRAEPDRFSLLGTPQAGGGVALAMNLSRAPFDDMRVRQALSLVLDSAEFVDLAGLADPAMVMTTLDRAGTALAAPDIRLPPRDLASARALIDEATAERGPVRFTLETFPNEGHLREANAIKALVERDLPGVEVRVAATPVPELMGRWRAGDFQATNYAIAWADPALDLAPAFASASPMNIMRYANAEADAALARLSGVTDPAAVVRAHHEVLRRVLADLPVIWLSHKEAFHAVDRRAVGAWPLVYSLRPMIEDVWLTGA
jgi:peptide/nickel transport system substrate-binding protein